MHQIIGLRSNGNALFELGIVAPSIADILQNPESYTEQFPPEERENLFFTEHHVIGEACRDWKYQDVIPLDIDNIKPEEAERIARVCCDCLGLDYAKVGVVFSGHGIQMHVLTERKIEKLEYFDEARELYKFLMQKINAGLKNAGLSGKADSKVWSSRRIMRMPNTINKKVGKNGVFAYVIQPHMEYQGFTLEGACGVSDIQTDNNIHHTAYSKFPRPDTKGVQEGCEFLKWCRQNPASVSEPQWYSMLSIVGRLENGETLAHDYSKGHPDYSATSTELKLKQSLVKAGPRTCKGIDDDWGKCSTCVFYKKPEIVSPISIRGPDFIGTEGTGFHQLIETPTGVKSVPSVDDLVKFFRREVGEFFYRGGNKIYIYEGGYWTDMELVEIECFSHTHFSPKPNNKLVAEFMGAIKRQNYKNSEWMIESTTRKLNLKNGVLDLETFVLSNHSSNYGFTHILPYAYDSEARCPAFDKFMQDVTLSRVDLESILFEFMGYSISGDDCWEHKALILIGEGSNGKSTLNKVLKKLVGKTGYSTLNMKAIKNDQKRVMLEGKLFNVGDENSPDSFMDSDLFKSLVSGDDVDVKHLYAQPYSFRNKTKLLFNCNKMPEADDQSHGMLRRLLFVPFDATFEQGDASTDSQIEHKLYTELPGILNRCIEGYLRLVKNRAFTSSSASDDIIEDYRVAATSIDVWCKEFLVKADTPTAFEDINSALYPAYIAWSRRMDIRYETSLNFIRRLTKVSYRMGFEKKRVGDSGIKYQRLYGAKLNSGF